MVLCSVLQGINRVFDFRPGCLSVIKIKIK